MKSLIKEAKLYHWELPENKLQIIKSTISFKMVPCQNNTSDIPSIIPRCSYTVSYPNMNNTGDVVFNTPMFYSLIVLIIHTSDTIWFVFEETLKQSLAFDLFSRVLRYQSKLNHIYGTVRDNDNYRSFISPP